MDRNTEDRGDLLELGRASETTRGNDLYAIEGVGFMPRQGISAE